MKRKDLIQYLSIFIIVAFITGVIATMAFEIDSLEKRLTTAETTIRDTKEIFDQAKSIQKHILQRNPKASKTAGEMSYWIIYCCGKYNLDTPQMIGQVETESNFNIYAIGPIGERGPLQVRLITWKEHGVGSFYDWRDTFESGARYIKWIKEHYGDSPRVILACYNAGPNRINREYVARHYIAKVNRCRPVLRGEEI